MSFCHMGNAVAGTGQGGERADCEVMPWLGQLLDFPKHQTDYSLIKCAIAVLCVRGQHGGGVKDQGHFPHFQTGLPLLYFWHTAGSDRVRPAPEASFASGYN